ncbi:MAG TPA: hypothetical protein VHZ78_03250 [Rhizomicrobium sp.]|jgi:hypothetical protein|nr:hypothetical protein [Rhizomicrobium sp.]
MAGGAGTDVEEAKLEISRYEELVDLCARERLNQAIPNGSIAHARVLIGKLFETARKSAVIVSDCLTDRNDEQEEVYADAAVVARARDFLRRPGTCLKIMLESAPHNGVNNGFLKPVVEDKFRKGEVVVYLNSGLVSQGLASHFMANDAQAYRRQIKDKKFEAVANFGDFKTAQLLGTLFEEAELYAKQKSVPRHSFNAGAKLSFA